MVQIPDNISIIISNKLLAIGMFKLYNPFLRESLTKISLSCELLVLSYVKLVKIS